jgi:hypothetical protein
MQQVNTRDGIFANQGYGGGLFNLNVGFGAADEGRPGPLRAQRDGSLGALMLDIPPDCFDEWAFRDCFEQYQGYAHETCADSDVLQNVYGGDHDWCMQDNISYDGWGRCVTAHCGSGEEVPQAVGPYEPYPWLAYSQQTKLLQQDVNTELGNRGCALLEVDGVLGPNTCGAAQTTQRSVPPTCKEFTEYDCEEGPKEENCPSGQTWNGSACVVIPPRIDPCPTGQTRQPNGTCLPPQHPKAKEPTKAWMMIGGLALAAAAAGVYVMSKKK